MRKKKECSDDVISTSLFVHKQINQVKFTTVQFNLTCWDENDENATPPSSQNNSLTGNNPVGSE